MFCAFCESLFLCVLIEVIVIVIVFVLSIRLKLKVLDKEVDLVDYVAAHADFDLSLQVIALAVGGSGELIGDLEIETLCLLAALRSIEDSCLLADSGDVCLFHTPKGRC